MGKQKAAYAMKTKSIFNSHLFCGLIGLAFTAISIIPTHAQAPVEDWVQRYGDVTSSADHAQKVVTDNAGNVIVAGYKSTGVNDDDWLTIKYSNTGVPVWTNYYDGPGHWTDQASALAVDTNGNVFVTGFSYNATIFTSADYTTIAYSSAGIPMWTNRYNGPTNSQDKATAIAVDANGNVFVTGYSANLKPSALISASWSYDYVTIAYSGDGVALWTNRYDRSGQNDQAIAIGTDGNGNVIVTGNSGTINYSNTGAPLWTNYVASQATALKVTHNGTTYVTGYSSSSGPTLEDYVTVAYSQTGLPLWTNRYGEPGTHGDRASALAVDGLGNVFVTGSSSGGESVLEYTTIAYTGAGFPLWTNRYGGPSNFVNEATAIAVDSIGNVYVTGTSRDDSQFKDYATVAYSSTGTLLWVNRFDTGDDDADFARSVAVSPNGQVIVTGYSNPGIPAKSDVITISYQNTGVPLWTNRFDGSGFSSDIPSAAATDSAGKIFLTGQSGGNYLTIAYSDAGLPLWTNRYHGQDLVFESSPISLAVDGNGNVFVTGYSWGSNAEDYATIKYSNSGVPMWTNHYNGLGNSTDAARDIIVDSTGDVYVTGYSFGASTVDYATIKYSNAGATIWNRKFYGGGMSRAIALAQDDNGNIFVTGDVWYGSRYSGATIAYSSVGVALWTNRIDLGANGRAVDLAVNAAGDVFVTGYSDDTNSSYDYLTVAYSNAGLPLWTNRYSGPGKFYDQPKAIAVERNSGTVYVTGSSRTSSTSGDDYATIAYSSAGVPLWTNFYNGPDNKSDYANAILIKGSEVIVAGASTIHSDVGNSGDGSPADSAFATIAYSSTGLPLWTNRYRGPEAAGSSWANSLTLDSSENIYVLGSSSGDFTTVKYVNPTPPSITLQPTSLTFGGSGFTLSIAASGTGPLTYQWRLSGVDIAGANASIFTLPSASVADAGIYDVVVSSPYGSVTSIVVAATFFGDLKFYAGTILAGSVGSTYRVDYADVVGENTNAWQTLTTVTLPYSPYLVIDPYSPTQSVRFYRTIPQ